MHDYGDPKIENRFKKILPSDNSRSSSASFALVSIGNLLTSIPRSAISITLMLNIDEIDDCALWINSSRRIFNSDFLKFDFHCYSRLKCIRKR